jgi:hypothetical protein
MEYKRSTASAKPEINYGDNDFFPKSMGLSIHNLHYFPFLFLQDHRKNYKYMAQMATGNQHASTTLNMIFFSQENVKIIQNLLKKETLKRTKGKIIIDDQDETDLILLMRDTYFEYARNVPHHVAQQVKELNNIVVETAIPGIMTNIKAYMSYIRDITLPIDPIDRPVNVSSAGRRTLPSVTSAF